MKCPGIIRSILVLASFLSTVSLWGIFTAANFERNERQVSLLFHVPKGRLPQDFQHEQPNDWPIFEGREESHFNSPYQTDVASNHKQNRSIQAQVDTHSLLTDKSATLMVASGGTLNLAVSNEVEETNPNSFDTARKMSLTPLRPVDREFYTIRMNTWKRHEQLIASIKHHMNCDGVAQIQVIWKESEDPPQEVLENPKVVIEKHDENKLNQRFNILIPTPTLGVFSVDDDILYPCEAVDMAFHAWTKNPERQVGFDRRRNRVRNDGKWQVRHKDPKRNYLSLSSYVMLDRTYLTISLSLVTRNVGPQISNHISSLPVRLWKTYKYHAD